MTAAFAAIETATAANAVAACANVSVTIGGSSVEAVFDNGAADALGIAGSGPTLELPTASAGAAAQGTAITVNSASYTVTHREDDSTGWTLLRLQEA